MHAKVRNEHALNNSCLANNYCNLLHLDDIVDGEMRTAETDGGELIS